MIPSVYCIILLEDHLDCLSTTCQISKTEKDIEEDDPDISDEVNRLLP